MNMKLLLCGLFCAVVTACSHGNCRDPKSQTPLETTTEASKGLSEESSMKGSLNVDRVKIFKPDGTLQCKQGKLIPIAEMQKQLQGIEVFSSENKNDGMMRIQVCGSPTGNSNVYEIARKDLEKALSRGFKEWLAE